MYEILSVFVQCNCVHVIFGFLNYLPGSSWMHGVLIIWRGALRPYGQFPNWKWTLISRPIRMLMIMIPPTFWIGFHF